MTTTPCPICRRALEATRWRPFCSRRCADADLGRWFAGAYRIPAEPAAEAEAPRLDPDEGMG